VARRPEEGKWMQPPNPQAQFESWWGTNRERFLAFAHRQAGGDIGVAEDAIQETGQYIWKRWGDYQPSPGDPIVLQILRHRLIDQLRKRGGLTFPGEEIREPPSKETPDEGLALQEALQDHQACVNELPDTPTQPIRAVHLLHQAGESDREIASQLNIPYSRARRLRMQANVAVRTCLLRRICHEDQHLLAMLQECIAALPEPKPQVFGMHWEGEPLGTIAKQVGAQEDRTLGLLEDATERVLRCLIGQLYGD
jgi:DNA-directed RNA polymerase specialized sigma24 family protein